MEKQKKRKKSKAIFSAIWQMRHLTLNECLAKISNDADLKFLLTISGIWFFLRAMIILLFLWRFSHTFFLIVKTVLG